MIVGRGDFREVVAKLSAYTRLAVDTETTGLRPFHGSRLFSIIIACSPTEGYYFNFQAYSGVGADQVLLPKHLEGLKSLFTNPSITWYAHNAKFDLHMLSLEGLEVAGDVHCTQSAAVLEDNTQMSYSLSNCAARIGQEKDDSVEKYIAEHKLWDWLEIPGKKTRKKDKYFWKVPFDVITPYGERDATITYHLGQHQEAAFQGVTHATPAGLPRLLDLHRNEKRLTKTIVRMERVGIQIDRDYCVRAARYESDRAGLAAEAYRQASGRDFKDSGKDFAALFAGERDKWAFTDKGNPSFESDTLATFEHPAAKEILAYRDAKSKGDFYRGYLYHADSRGVVHPSWNQGGAPRTGRLSSSEPNFQNLTSENWGKCEACGEGLEIVSNACPACGSDKICQYEYLVRRALVPREGFLFLAPDYNQMEYLMMFDYACQVVGFKTELVKQIEQGLDPHQAMANTVSALGYALKRSRAKNVNFAKLYGSGEETFAWTAGIPLSEAKRLMHAVDVAAPEIGQLVSQVKRTAKVRKYIFNWAGRRYLFPDSRFAYKAPNYMIQGGSADVMKILMNRVDQHCIDKGLCSRLVGTVHDEPWIEAHKDEAQELALFVKNTMETIFPWKYLPLTAGMEYATRSLADKMKGMPG